MRPVAKQKINQGFDPWAALMCLVSASDLVYLFPHPVSLQKYVGFSLAFRCVFSCFFRWSFLPKSLQQLWHLNGFSPLCVLLCLVNSSFLANAFPHPTIWHRNGFSPEERNKKSNVRKWVACSQYTARTLRHLIGQWTCQWRLYLHSYDPIISSANFCKS